MTTQRGEPREISTKIAGVAMHPQGLRQQALALLEQRPEQARGLHLKVRPEPENSYDADALGIWARFSWVELEQFPEAELVPTQDGEGAWFQLGYVPNRDCTCSYCLATYTRYPKDGICRTCKNDVSRVGTATRLAHYLRQHPEVRYYAEILQITGGGEDMSYGANVILKPRVQGPIPLVESLETSTISDVVRSAPKAPSRGWRPKTPEPVRTPTREEFYAERRRHRDG